MIRVALWHATKPACPKHDKDDLKYAGKFNNYCIDGKIAKGSCDAEAYEENFLWRMRHLLIGGMAQSFYWTWNW